MMTAMMGLTFKCKQNSWDKIINYHNNLNIQTALFLVEIWANTQQNLQ